MYGPGLAISDFNLGVLYMLAVSSLSTYGILLAGWSANSKYAFLGSLRSTAQLISYELILSSAILLVVLFTGSLNLTVIIEAQKAIWFIIPIYHVFMIVFIGALAETNRAPFDLAEADIKLNSASIKVIICWKKIIYVKYLLSAGNIIFINNKMFISETKHNHLKKIKYEIVQKIYKLILLLTLSFFVFIFSLNQVNCYNIEIVSLDNLINTCSIIPVKVFSDLNNIDTIKSYRNELKNKQGMV